MGINKPEWILQMDVLAPYTENGMIKLFAWFWNVDPKWRVIKIRWWNEALLQNDMTLDRKESTFRWGVIEE